MPMSSEVLSTSTATHVSLRYSDETTDTIELNELFPAMQQLSVDGARYLPFLSHHFEHLTQFTSTTPIRDTDNFLAFMRANPQLESLKVQSDWTQQNLLHQINEALPHLRQLHVEFLYPNSMCEPANEAIHFRSVRNLTVTLTGVYDELSDIARRTLDALVFDGLESLEMDASIAVSKDFLIDLIGRNRDLRTVQIGHFHLSYHQLARLVAALPKLKALAMMCLTSADIHNVHRFLAAPRSASSLATVSVWTDSHGLQMLRNVGAALAQWRMSHESVGDWEHVVTFERN